ncbi:GNAT family N-acetyltransferase [Rubrivirga marina]|uniref:GNAT family N-acetyltransferase n=1 Tax=Rubrivirga marina TaxID=1196024 RepID=A0A271IY36_9BACT|nr:N-acetyltransferase [Rubrivirga marina]PAP76133.1 GNAT family N-acetyltransferase [Rubrivirga marina]
MSEPTIRPERPSDRDAVYRVNEAAFGQPDEADLVDRLRERSSSYLGLVAEVDGIVVGHILFTPVTLDPSAGSGQAVGAADVRGLAPMAVLPEHQRSGVGSALVRAGLAACAADGAEAVVVLGHPAYYPRFGFKPASAFGIACAYDVPSEAFMALERVEGALTDAAGVVRYHPAFGG